MPGQSSRIPLPAARPVVHYVPADSAMLAAYELAVSQAGREAAKRAENQRSHARWAHAKAVRDARDRANRRIMWRVAIVAVLVVLTAVGYVIWQLTRVMAAHADAILGGIALALAAAVLVPLAVRGGCKMVITIWHSR